MNLKLSVKGYLFFVLFFIVFVNPLFPQNTEKDPVEIARAHYNFARLMADNLSEKLSLTNNQKKVIVDILIDYQENLLAIHNELENSKELGSSNELVGKTAKERNDLFETTGSESDEQIESILNRNQLSKYYRIKTEWWNRLNTVALSKF